MVRVNFRMNDEIRYHQFIQFFKDIGYEYIKSKDSSITVESEAILTDVFVRNTTKGRYHIYIAFGEKYSGAEPYPQVKVFAHFDIKKLVKGKERHFADRNEKRNMAEMYQIDKKMKKAKLGFLEMKDQLCAHGTLDIKDKDKLMEYIEKRFKRYDKGKYRRRMNEAQCTIALFEQEKFIHIVCVYAKIIGKDHDLVKSKAIEELKEITEFITKSDF